MRGHLRLLPAATGPRRTTTLTRLREISPSREGQLVTVRAANARAAPWPAGSVVRTVSTSGLYPGRGGVLYVALESYAVRVSESRCSRLAPDVRVQWRRAQANAGHEITGPARRPAWTARSGRDPDSERPAPPTRCAVLRSAGGRDHAGREVFWPSDRAPSGATGTGVH